MSSTRRKRATQTMSCPICLKPFNRSTMSISDFNDHIIRCSDAQYSLVDQTTTSENRIQLTFDERGNVIEAAGGEDAASEKCSRAKSIECLTVGDMGETYESLLLKHLGKCERVNES